MELYLFSTSINPYLICLGEKRHNEAAIILTEHLVECGEEAVEVLADGHFWQDAYRLTAMLGRMDLCETHLKPCILDAADIVMSNIEELRDKFIEQVTIFVKKLLGTLNCLRFKIMPYLKLFKFSQNNFRLLVLKLLSN